MRVSQRRAARAMSQRMRRVAVQPCTACCIGACLVKCGTPMDVRLAPDAHDSACGLQRALTWLHRLGHPAAQRANSRPGHTCCATVRMCCGRLLVCWTWCPGHGWNHDSDDRRCVLPFTRVRSTCCPGTVVRTGDAPVYIKQSMTAHCDDFVSHLSSPRCAPPLRGMFEPFGALLQGLT
jgi:hypothetical protein